MSRLFPIRKPSVNYVVESETPAGRLEAGGTGVPRMAQWSARRGREGDEARWLAVQRWGPLS